MPDAILLGSSRTRDLRELRSLGGWSWDCLPVSNGGFSSLLFFLRAKLAPHFERVGKWPTRVVLITQARDFEPNDNHNLPGVLWDWKDCLSDLRDGLDEKERDFLRMRMISLMRRSAFFLDRNYRLGAAALMGKAGNRSAGEPPADFLVGKVNAVLEGRDAREERSLDTLEALLREKGVALTVVSMPYAATIEARLDSVRLREYRSALVEGCLRNGCTTLIASGAALGLDEAQFSEDRIHMNAAGSRAFSEWFAARLFEPRETKPGSR